ncbi:MAG: insulinase family protein [Gemmiger formicilis]|uniref:EF-P 5-aminopentanol modification-associated protein YfmH n=1 Tax=Gemmiger formicilis TaxID=745368 RepID=UPI003FEF474E|nr:insulinase family protein [Gemmiger formicilis]
MLNNDHESFAAAQARAAAAVSCESVVLPSGLTVLCRTMPGYSSVHAIYATGFGSVHRAFRLDGKQITLPAGTAHFLEHKMCETPKGDSFTFYAKTGASANAFTSYDRTCYLFSATQKIDENLDILLGMVGKPWFTKATIAKEQGIIGQEIKMYDDSPDWRLITGLFECLYHSHPIRSDIAGTVESIAEITPAMLYNSCKAFYAPGNMVLAAAGNTTMEQILAACARHGLMEPRPAQRVQRLWTPEPMTLAATEKTLTMPVSKPCFGVGFKEEPLPAGDLRTEALYDLVLSCIVGGMSPLYRRLYDEGLVNPGFGGEVLRVDGCCCILFTGESDVPDTVRQLLLDEIARVRAAGVDREVFTLCKNEKYGQLIENLENVEDSASQMADFALSGQTVAQQISMLAGLTAEDADAALQHILCTDRMATMYILPDGTAQAAEEDEEEEE